MAKKTKKKGSKNIAGVDLLVCEVVKAAIRETLERARRNIRGEQEPMAYAKLNSGAKLRKLGA
jgi:hypothetical protein